uniref:Uncharacterized protein n=1 Tax=Anguilla anguilla TaxID=7936 RepID=A0A0E9PKX6_ANGAN
MEVLLRLKPLSRHDEQQETINPRPLLRNWSLRDSTAVQIS